MLKDVSSKMPTESEKPVVVMDAGIATEENLSLIRSDEFDYDYVSRIVPKEYKSLTQSHSPLCSF